jgi:hypothetical protein
MAYSDFDKHEIELEILEYFLKNPNAQDTFEGIAEWWLLETYIRKQSALVKQALSELVNQGLVIEIQDSNAQIHYRVNQEKIQEIQERLIERRQQ